MREKVNAIQAQCIQLHLKMEGKGPEVSCHMICGIMTSKALDTEIRMFTLTEKLEKQDRSQPRYKSYL